MNTQESESSEGQLESGSRSPRKAAHLIWEDVSVVANNFRKGATKKLLNRLTGFAESYRILAVMGPSGSGKSILLDALAGRLSPSLIMTGDVLLNGKERSIASRNISYTVQEDFHLGTLTVRETLTYSAHLRLPSTMRKNEIEEVVENTIVKMGLQDCADNMIGNWHLRGISSGEKRRVSIGHEILTQPHVMFVDEPTSGLDSASAFFVVQALRNIAHDGKILVCSIHQPSSYIFDLFDDLCLLSSGETIYFGEANLAIKFFSDSGFPCPTRRNPSDHFLRCINSDFDKIAATLLPSIRDQATPESSSSQMNLTTDDIKAILKEKYKNSEYSLRTRKSIRQMKLINEEFTTVLSKNNNSWWKQLRTLTTRSFLNMSRDMGYYWVRILFFIIISLSAGMFYFDIGLSNSAFVTRAKCYTYFYDFLICLSVGGLPSFSEEWKVSHHELLNGHYGEAVLILSNFISSFPFLTIISLSSSTIIYYMVKFHAGFSIFCYLSINLFLCITIMESIGMTVALLVPTFLMGVGVSAAVIMILTISSGLYMPLGDLPRIFWYYPITYISFASWAVQGQYKNDMIGLEFEPLVPGEPLVTGAKILSTLFGIDLGHSKWWDLAVLFVLLVCHKLLYFMVLNHKERSFLLRRLYTKRTLEYLAKRPSFRKEKHSSSRRHQPLHPLSAQDGLSSPVP